jgi:hypothetical protein
VIESDPMLIAPTRLDDVGETVYEALVIESIRMLIQPGALNVKGQPSLVATWRSALPPLALNVRPPDVIE